MSDQWYARYTGDYGRDTRGLTLAQHGAYTLLLDQYYSAGTPLQADPVALYRICAAMDDAERAAVDHVARVFFPVGGDGLRHNSRADKEIQRRAEQHNRLSDAGRKGMERRWSDNQANNQANNQVIASPPPPPPPHPKPPPEGEGRGTAPPAPPTLPDKMPENGWSRDIVARIASDPHVAVTSAMADSYFDTRTAAGWVDAAGRSVARTRAQLASDLRRWKVKEPSRGKSAPAQFGKSGERTGPPPEWTAARDASADAVWRAKEQDPDNPDALRKAMAAARDKYRDVPRHNGVDAVDAGIKMALNNKRAKVCA